MSIDQLIESVDVDLFSQLLSRFAIRSGVAGVQPKVLFDTNNPLNDPLNQKPDQIHDHQQEQKTTYPINSYIVKSWGAEYPELACNEFICLSMAKAAGLTVSPFYLSDNGRLLIAKRFDIDANGLPIGFEDFCVLQAKSTKQKYDASLESCANTIRQFISPEHRATALYDFFKLTLLNIILRNGDAHLKNYGVIYNHLADYRLGNLPSESVMFSPVFDIVSTVLYIENDTMALSLTGSKRWPKWKVLVKFAKQHCQLSNKQIEQILVEIEEAKLITLPLIEDIGRQHKNFSGMAAELTILLNKSLD